MTKKKKKNVEDESKITDYWSKISSGIKKFSVFILITFLLIPFMILVFLIDQKVSKANVYQFDGNSLEIRNDMPQWVLDYNLYEKIRLNNNQVQKSYIGKSYFNKNTLGMLHSKMAKNPWLKEIQLSKEMPNKIYADIKFREPKVSFLVSNKAWYYLDEEYILLPLKETMGEEEISIVRITGLKFTNKELKAFSPGLRLNKKALLKSMSLIDEVKARAEILHDLKEIKISFLRKKTTPRFKLIFENGLEVLWGEFLFSDEIDGFPGKQLSTQMKLDQLVKKLTKKPNALFCNVEYKN